MRMHEDQVDTSVDLVRALLREQFPQWADLRVTRVTEFGTDHALYRIGDDLVARLPIIHWAVDQVESDRRWMPVLGPRLPLQVPQPVAVGTPGLGYPYSWLVVDWLSGQPPTHESLDQVGAADDLAGFVRALHAQDTTGGMLKQGLDRGVPLAWRDAETRAAIEQERTRVDAPALLAAWEDALAADPWNAPPVWIHGDLLAGNLLAHDGRLTGVIDFGALGLGDPAADVAPAWSVFDADGRDRYRSALGYDEHTWRRGRGWAITTSVVGLDYYAETVPAFTRRGLRTIGEVLAEGLR